METEKLKQSYKNQLVKAGVDSHTAEQAVKNMSGTDLQLIREVWSEGTVFIAHKEYVNQNSLNYLFSSPQ